MEWLGILPRKFTFFPNQFSEILEFSWLALSPHDLTTILDLFVDRKDFSDTFK